MIEMNGREGSKSRRFGSTLMGDCLLPLEQRDHLGFKRPQKFGPVGGVGIGFERFSIRCHFR